VLVSLLSAETFWLRRGALAALNELGWTPGDEAARVASAVAGGDWEFAAEAGAAAARPLRQVLREAESGFGIDEAADAEEAECARQALERVVFESAAEIDTDLLRELADLDMEIFYSRTTHTVGAYTYYETVRLGDTQQIENLAAEELMRRGVFPEDFDFT
jgi:hypothetical protein